MKKLKAKIGLRIVRFGIWIMELQPYGLLDAEDKENLQKLWQWHDKFVSDLK